jgi:hypothetical protein
LIKSLFQIIRLQKGPDTIPGASVAFVAVCAMWFAAAILTVLIFDNVGASDISFALLVGASGLFCYAALLAVFGKSARLLPMLTSMVGCGALLLTVFAAVFAVLKPFVGADDALLVAYPFTLWSVPVEGHIIARTLDKPFVAGFIFAFAVFVLQVLLQELIDPRVLET